MSGSLKHIPETKQDLVKPINLYKRSERAPTKLKVNIPSKTYVINDWTELTGEWEREGCG